MPKMCGNGVVEMDNNETCDDGEENGVHNCRTDCQPTSCGDGHVDLPDEECDDGPMKNGNGKHCREDCIINRCGDGFIETGREQCDGALPAAWRSPEAVPVETSGCNLDCTKPVCGDGKTNRHFMPDGVHTEECDDGMGGVQMESARCNAGCTFARCGDDTINATAGETCDDVDANGASLNGVPCDYGNPFCFRCNATCTGQVNPGGPFCGDGIPQPRSEGRSLALIEPHEQCDPGTGPSPPNPDGSQPREAKNDSADCNKDCTQVVCGDGYVNTVAHENCDDGNRSTCGTCPSITDMDCRGATPNTPTQASATITPTGATQINEHEENDTFTLNDGFGNEVTFEFTVASTLDGTHVAIPFVKAPADDATTIATKMTAAINGQAPQGLGITARVSVPASGGTPTVILTNNRKSSLGNGEIRFTGLIGFMFSGMTGGLAGDCATDTGCVFADDCKSGFCSSGKCQPCTMGNQCESGFCSNGTCQPCTMGNQCESGFCSSGTCQPCTADGQCPESTTCDVPHGKCH